MEVSKRNKGGGGVVTTQKQCKKKFWQSCDGRSDTKK